MGPLQNLAIFGDLKDVFAFGEGTSCLNSDPLASCSTPSTPTSRPVAQWPNLPPLGPCGGESVNMEAMVFGVRFRSGRAGGEREGQAAACLKELDV
ncbi:hypothetical protein P7K49_007237, partial [Saguinus oedipus]